jgi:hypothetical protein
MHFSVFLAFGFAESPPFGEIARRAGQNTPQLVTDFAVQKAGYRRSTRHWMAGAKSRGVYKGRRASIDPAKVKTMKEQGMDRQQSQRH